MSSSLFGRATLPVHADNPNHILVPTLMWAAGASIVTMPESVSPPAESDPTWPDWCRDNWSNTASIAIRSSPSITMNGGVFGLAALTAVAPA